MNEIAVKRLINSVISIYPSVKGGKGFIDDASREVVLLVREIAGQHELSDFIAREIMRCGDEPGRSVTRIQYKSGHSSNELDNGGLNEPALSNVIQESLIKWHFGKLEFEERCDVMAKIKAKVVEVANNHGVEFYYEPLDRIACGVFALCKS